MQGVLSNITVSDLIPYCIFPNSFIRNGKLSAQERILFQILCSYDFVDKQGNRKGWCDPSQIALSQHLGLDAESVRIYTKRLIEKGLVTLIYRNDRNDKRSDSCPKTNIYILNIIPGLSEADRKRIAATRTIDIKNLISGLNTIKVQTREGVKYISKEEFDLQYLITGERSSDIIEGEIIEDLDSLDNDNEQEPNSVEVKSNLNNLDEKTLEQELGISFKKPKTPINTDKVAKGEGYNSDNVVSRILAGNYKNLKTMDYCQYFRFKYGLKYKAEVLAIDTTKDPSAIKNLLKEFEPQFLVDLINYFIENYDKLFANTQYPRPKIYQLNIKWILNKVLENYYIQEQHKESESTQAQISFKGMKTMKF